MSVTESIGRILDLLLPRPCLGCGRPIEGAGPGLGLCRRCFGRLVPSPSHACHGCGQRLGVAALVETRCFERDVTLRMPFRFGVVTLTHAPQIFLRACIRLEDGRTGWGTAAEMLAPKWFDKNPALSNEENFQQLRDVVKMQSGRGFVEQVERGARGALRQLLGQLDPLRLAAR